MKYFYLMVLTNVLNVLKTILMQKKYKNYLYAKTLKKIFK